MEPAQKHSVVEGSRSTGMHALRPSQLSHRPSTSMTKAVSELNPSLKPDWNESRESVFSSVLISCRLTTFSIIFLKKGRRKTVVIKDGWVQKCPLEDHLFQNWENHPFHQKKSILKHWSNYSQLPSQDPANRWSTAQKALSTTWGVRWGSNLSLKSFKSIFYK